ncbi:hypothetical protein GCK72_004325 [Caenorhabditis remanei]|uniref:DUF38 domain-containing protein n=1 Tax=Caenorhabditis remanei TaxID=31234 RepID=A0A6A5H9G4_CAERE|nr:hypothetical protein GCK72_004325 [Caenorhabditis remanei]KAF1764378.1 hypothetical protein GCK72_004325 [Caenorhabditis remanei]
MPMNIGKLDIHLSDRVSIEFSDPIIEENRRTTYANWPYGSYYTLKGISEAVNDIGIVFSNPNIKITRLVLDMGYIDPAKQEFQANFVQCLKSMMSSLPHQIHVEYVLLNCIEILPFLKAEKLKWISLAGESTDDSLYEIAHLEQIKRVPGIRILHMLDHMPFDLIPNTSKFSLFVRNFSKSDFTRFVEQNLQEENFKFEFLSKHHAVKTDDGHLIATLEGPKFKNTVEVGGIEGKESVVFRRTT